jgi:hypothetical protein
LCKGAAILKFVANCRVASRDTGTEEIAIFVVNTEEFEINLPALFKTKLPEKCKSNTKESGLLKTLFYTI